MSKDKRIILDAFVNSGDRVIIHSIPDYNRHPDLPVGTVLICKGHTQWHRDVDFGSIGKDRPRGRYLKFGAALYVVANAEKDFPQYKDRYITYSAHNLVFEDETLDPQKTRRDTFEWKMDHEGVKVADLPETDFVFGDRVHFNDEECTGEHNRLWPKDARFRYGVVQSVTYGLPENPNILYDIGVYFEREDGQITRGYSYPYVDGKRLVLKERGNFYHYLHDQGKITFADLNERASFHTAIGDRECERNPRNELYLWTLDEALLYIRNGRGACLNVEPGLFGADAHLQVYSFPGLRGLEEELRQATLEGFAEQYAALEDGKEVELSPTRAEWEAELIDKKDERKKARATNDLLE